MVNKSTLFSVLFNLLISGLLLIGQGCTRNSSTATSTIFSATMGSAVKVGRAHIVSSTVAGPLANTVTDQDLVSIDSTGTATRVFNVSFPIYGIKLTTNYVIVSGSFVSTVASPVVDQNGTPLTCYLYAISKTATNKSEDIRCLSRSPVGSYNPTAAATNAHSGHLGFATRGTKVYFTNFASGILYSWTEGASQTEQVFAQTPPFAGVGMDDVYLDANSNNICVLMSALGSTFFGILYCGTDSGLTATITGTDSHPVIAETMQLGKWVVTTAEKVDITNISGGALPRTANGNNGALPTGTSFTSSAGGGIIGLGYAWSLVNMDASGNTGLLDNDYASTGQYWQAMFTSGNYAWFYATSSAHDPTAGVLLRRVDITSNQLLEVTGTPDSGLNSTNCNDYPVTGYTNSTAATCTQNASALEMTSITGMGLTPNGNIQISGTNGLGVSVTALISSTGAITPSSSVQTTLDQIVPLY